MKESCIYDNMKKKNPCRFPEVWFADQEFAPNLSFKENSTEILMDDMKRPTWMSYLSLYRNFNSFLKNVCEEKLSPNSQRQNLVLC